MTHIFKSTKAYNSKFCMFPSFMHTIISPKFQINQLTLTLFSGSGQKPLAGEISKCRRLWGYLKIFLYLLELKQSTDTS